jgi:hypothetical protein
MDPWIAIPAAGFQQQDGGPAIGSQPVRQYAASRTGADDDEIEFLGGGHDVSPWLAACRHDGRNADNAEVVPPSWPGLTRQASG